MPECRPGTAALAVLVIGGTIVLAVRAIRRTAVADAEQGGSAPLIGPQVRAWYRGLLAPLEAGLASRGVTPDQLTWGQLGVSVLAGVAFAGGALFLGGWLVILAGTLDILDGGLARRAGTASARGAFLDSVVDRWAEFATFVGLGAYFRDDPMLLVVALAAFGSQMVSYARARAEGLGIALLSGRAQRPERYVLLGFGAFVSGLVAHLGCLVGGGPPRHWVLRLALVMLAAISLWTAVERTRDGVRALRGARGRS
ncbi:MAG: CDP-alcohol phosphatidyltransferase family protein [bacterium]|nr:CDP-alcohol phosphatidyltransferase family protein [bacterium]